MPWAFTKAAEHQRTQSDIPEPLARITFGTQVTQTPQELLAKQTERIAQTNSHRNKKQNVSTLTSSASNTSGMENARTAKARAAKDDTTNGRRPKELQLLDRFEQTKQHLEDAQKALETTRERAERSRTMIVQMSARLHAERSINESHAMRLKQLRQEQTSSTSPGAQTDAANREEIKFTTQSIVRQRRKVTSLTNDLRLSEATLETYDNNVENLQLRCIRLEARLVSLRSEDDSVVDGSQAKIKNAPAVKAYHEQGIDTTDIATMSNNHIESARTIAKQANDNHEFPRKSSQADAMTQKHNAELSARPATPIGSEPEKLDNITASYKEQVRSLRKITSEQNLLIDKLYQEIEALHASSRTHRSASSSPGAVVNPPIATLPQPTTKPVSHNKLPVQNDHHTSSISIEVKSPDTITSTIPVSKQMDTAVITLKDPRHSLSFLGNASEWPASSLPAQLDRRKDLSISRLISQDAHMDVSKIPVVDDRTKQDSSNNLTAGAMTPESTSNPGLPAKPDRSGIPVPQSQLDPQTRIAEAPVTSKRGARASKRSDIKQSNRCTACIENKKYCNGEPICESCKLFYIGHELPEQYCSYPFIPKDKSSKRVTPADYIPDLNLEDADAALATLQLKRKSRFWRTSTNADFPELQGVEPEAQTPVPKPVETGSSKRSDRLKGKVRRRYDSVSDDGTPASKRSRTSSEANPRTSSPLITRRGTVISFRYHPEVSVKESLVDGRAETKCPDGPAPGDKREEAAGARADSSGSFRPVMPNFAG